MTMAGTTIMASTPPKIASVANPVALMSMPDRMPAPAPKIWYQTSILPWVAARTSGRVPCTTSVVPETKPIFHPSPSKTRAINIPARLSPGDSAPTSPVVNSVSPPMIVVRRGPTRSTNGPVYWRWQPHGTHVQPDDETDSTHAVVVGAHVYRGHGHDR